MCFSSRVIFSILFSVSNFLMCATGFSQAQTDESQFKEGLVIRVRLKEQLLVYSRKNLAHVKIQPIVNNEVGSKISTKPTQVLGDVYKFGFISPEETPYELGQEFLVEGYSTETKRKIVARLKLVDENTSEEIYTRYAEGDDVNSISTILSADPNQAGQKTKFYVDFLSRRALKNVYVSVMTQPYSSVLQPVATNVIFDVYRLHKVLDAAKDAGVTISATVVADGSQFTDHFVVNKTSEIPTLKFYKRETKSKEQVDQELAAYQAAERARDPFGFVTLLNEYRAQLGLGALVHDPALAVAAQQNNYTYLSTGNVHGVVVGLSGWAMANDAFSALNMWKNSGAHNALMINPSSTRCGFDITNGSATFQIQ